MSLVGPRQLCLHLFCLPRANSRNTSRGNGELARPEAYCSLSFGSFLLRLRFLHLLINLNEENGSLHISGRGCFGSPGIRREVNKKSRAASSLARRVTSTFGRVGGSS